MFEFISDLPNGVMTDIATDSVVDDSSESVVDLVG